MCLITLDTHSRDIIEKLDVVDRTQAVARGYELGLLRTSASRHPRPRL